MSIKKKLNFSAPQSSDDKEEIPVNVESSPQTTLTPSVAAQVQAPSSQPEVDEDGYCIQPKDPLWELQTMKKGGKCILLID